MWVFVLLCLRAGENGVLAVEEKQIEDRQAENLEGHPGIGREMVTYHLAKHRHRYQIDDKAPQ